MTPSCRKLLFNTLGIFPSLRRVIKSTKHDISGESRPIFPPVQVRVSNPRCMKYYPRILYGSYQSLALVELVLDFLAEAIGVGGQLQVVLGVALLCEFAHGRGLNQTNATTRNVEQARRQFDWASRYAFLYKRISVTRFFYRSHERACPASFSLSCTPRESWEMGQPPRPSGGQTPAEY